MAKRLTWWILGALVLGGIVGLALHHGIDDGSPASAARLKQIAGYLTILVTIFLRLIKMIIAPLVFSTLVVGIAHMGDTKALGRIGFRAVGWFVCASLMSLTLGLVIVHITKPGLGLNLPLPPANASSGVAKTGFDFADFITHVVPQSMIEAMATNEIIQIVVFSLFVGVAITAVGDKAEPLVKGIEALVAVMLKITNYVMALAPIAVFGAVSSTLAERGAGVIGNLAYFMGAFYVSLFILWALLIGLGFLFVGPKTRYLVKHIDDPLLIAFTTASSEAAFPRILEALDRFGVPSRISSFVLPLGYSFNLDGSMMYMTFASLFIAQAYGIQLGLGEQITMLLVLMITSKGVAGVPRASLVVIAATLPLFKIPEAGLLLILAVDHFLDMGRSATNVIGNAVAASVVAKWEGTLDEPDEVKEAAGA